MGHAVKPFDTLTSVAAPMPVDDLDTDVIFPARYLLITDKRGLGAHAFRDLRFDAEGRERPDFVLHRAPWRGAQILVTGANFGCGSSREQAPWALLDLGLRCIVAPSFGEIFRGNCLHNGLLPVTLAAREHARVMRAAHAGQALCVDLHRQTLTLADGRSIAFDVGARAREALLRGHDEIDRILAEHGADIEAYEARRRADAPWLELPAPPV